MKFHKSVLWLFVLVAALGGLSSGPATAQQADPPILEYPQTMLRGFVSAEFKRPGGDCRRICEERSGCAGFDFSSSTNMCRLYAAVSAGQSEFSYSAGTRNRIAGYRDPANLPPPPDAASWHFAQFTGVDLYGGDIVPKGLEMNDPAMCASACERDNTCKAFTFNGEQNRCFIKTGYEFVQSAAGVTSGMFFRAKPAEARVQLNAEWDLFLMSDLPGNDLGEVPAQSYDQCMRRCEGNASCGGFTWVYFSRQDHCYLKYGTSLFPSRTTKGMVSARKSNRDIVPDFVRPTPNRDY